MRHMHSSIQNRVIYTTLQHLFQQAYSFMLVCVVQINDRVDHAIYTKGVWQQTGPQSIFTEIQLHRLFFEIFERQEFPNFTSSQRRLLDIFGPSGYVFVYFTYYWILLIFHSIPIWFTFHSHFHSIPIPFPFPFHSE